MSNQVNHHYVWRYYLTAWESKDKHAWVCRKSNNSATPFCTSLKNICAERYFYEPKTISPAGITLLQEQIGMIEELGEPVLEEICNTVLTNVINFSMVNAYFESCPKVAPENKATYSNIKKKFKNVFEIAYYGQQENDNVKALQHLRTGDIGFLNDDEARYLFFIFLSEQYMRTQCKRTMISNVIKNEIERTGCELNGVELPLMQIWARKLGYALVMTDAVVEKYVPSILRSPTPNVPFITTDQPVINVAKSNVASSDIALYMPVSPNYALLFDHKDHSAKLKENEVHFYNKLMIKESHENIISNSKEVLLQYVA